MAKRTEQKKAEQQTVGYDRYLEGSNIRVTPLIWAIITSLLALILGISLLFLLPGRPTIAIMTFIATPVLMFGFPVVMKEKRDSKITNSIPDVFEELATSLRAGATIEQALLDLTKIQKGPLIEELKIALNDMEGGFSFEEALENLIERVDVMLLKRILKIVIDGRKAGGQLADILYAVSSDARDMARLQRERLSKTLMYVIFLFAAGAAVAPLIFGFVTQIAEVVANVGAISKVSLSSMQPSSEALASSPSVTNPLETSIFGANISLLWIYLVIECTISGIMMAFVRGAKIWKGLLFYSLTMAFVATIIFEISKVVAAMMLSNAAGGALPA